MTEDPTVSSQLPSSSLPLAAIDYNQQSANVSSDWTATKALPQSSHTTPSYLSRNTEHNGPDSSTSTTPPLHPTDIGHPMSALLEEDDLLFEVDFDTETLEQMHSVYEKDRFPSEDRIEQLAAQAAKRMESTDEGASLPDEAELQRRIREWFSKERTKDTKNGKPLPTPGTMSPKHNSFGNAGGAPNDSQANQLPMPPAFGNLGLRNGNLESPSAGNSARNGAHTLPNVSRDGDAETSNPIQPNNNNHDDAAIDPDLAGLPPVPTHWSVPISPTRDTARILDFNHGQHLENNEIVVDPNLMDLGSASAEGNVGVLSPTTTLMTAIAAARGEDISESYANGDRLALSLGAAFEQREGSGQKGSGSGFEGVNGDLGVDDETRTQVESQGSNEKPEIDLVAWLRKSYTFVPPPYGDKPTPTVLREDLYTQMARDLPSSCPLPSKDQVAALVIKAFPKATWESSVTEGPVYAVRGLVKKVGNTSKHRYTKSCNLSELAEVALNRELTASTEAENASTGNYSPPDSASVSLVTGTPRRSALDDLAHAAGLVEQSPMDNNGPQFPTLEEAAAAARNEGLAVKKRRTTASSGMIIPPQVGLPDDAASNSDWQATGWSTSQGNPYGLGWPHDTTLNSVVSQFQGGEELPAVPSASVPAPAAGPVKRKRASTKGNSKRGQQNGVDGVLHTEGQSDTRASSAHAGPSSSRSGSAKGKQKKPIYTNQANVSSTDPNVKHYKPNFTYHELITHEIKRSADGRLQLSEIYRRISERYPYFKLGEPGWQNSIRHNLSLKKCFVRVDRPSDNAADKAGKGGWWTYNPGTDADGRPGRKGLSGKGTGEYRKGSTPSDIASRSGSQEREMEVDQQVQPEQQHVGGAGSESLAGTPGMVLQYPPFQFDQSHLQPGL